MDKLEEAVEIAKEFNFTISSFYILGDGIQKLFNLFDPVSKETLVFLTSLISTLSPLMLPVFSLRILTLSSLALLAERSKLTQRLERK